MNIEFNYSAIMPAIVARRMPAFRCVETNGNVAFIWRDGRRYADIEFSIDGSVYAVIYARDDMADTWEVERVEDALDKILVFLKGD